MKRALNPHISVDCVIFGFNGNKLQVLLINRDMRTAGTTVDTAANVNTDATTSDIAGATASCSLKLPGDLIIKGEPLHESARRILKEYTGLDNIFLQQFGVFDNPERLSDEENLCWLRTTSGLPDIDRVVTIAYYSLIKLDMSHSTALSIAYNARWYPVDAVPGLIFDHNDILDSGLMTLRKAFLTDPLCFELLPVKFTVNQLQKIYEIILGYRLDNRNFRKKINRLDYIIPLNERQKGVSHKPARFYVFDKKRYNKFKKAQTGFII
jgi:8-oxo-dGTP diphosphatase